MEVLVLFNEWADEFEKYLRLKTRVLAIKLLKKGDEIPKNAVRPLKDLGHHLSLCQAFALSRRQEMPIAIFKEDNWCFEPVVGYGFAEPPQYFLDGHNRYPDTARTLEAGSRWAHNMPKLEVGRYVGIVSAPLSKAGFEPDVVMIYCDPAQLTQIMIAVNWIDGNDVSSVLSGHSACVYAVVPVVLNRQFQVSVPCIGDRKRAMAQDDELIFSMPKERVKDLLEGLRALESSGGMFPIKYSVLPESQLEESYAKCGKMVGLDI